MRRFYILGVAMGMSAFLSSLFGWGFPFAFRSGIQRMHCRYGGRAFRCTYGRRICGGAYCRGDEHRRVTTGFRTEEQGRFTEEQDHSLVLPEWETQQESCTDSE